MRARRATRLLLAVAAALGGCLPAWSAPTVVEGDGVRLVVDPKAWRQGEAAPPVLIDLVCQAADCGAGSRLVVVADDRLLARPGAGAFTPGALLLAQVVGRSQGVTPAGRLLHSAPVGPTRVGPHPGYLIVGEVEARTLERRPAIAIVVPRLDRVVHLRLEGPFAAAALADRRQALLSSVEIR